MKVGIMSMQRVENYGSFLQAYGLKKEIEKLGHTVQFVDYQAELSVVLSEEEQKSGSANRKISKAFHMLSPTYRAWRKKQIKMNSTFQEFSKAYNEQFLNIPWLHRRIFSSYPNSMSKKSIISARNWMCW